MRLVAVFHMLIEYLRLLGSTDDRWRVVLAPVGGPGREGPGRRTFSNVTGGRASGTRAGPRPPLLPAAWRRLPASPPPTLLARPSLASCFISSLAPCFTSSLNPVSSLPPPPWPVSSSLNPVSFLLWPPVSPLRWSPACPLYLASSLTSSLQPA